jgi:hypothetical protein
MKLAHLVAMAATTIALSSTSAWADDWLAAQLRGQVLQLVNNQWQPLERGMVVPDDRVLRTAASGHVTLTRGQETLDLGPNTQIQIHDRGTAGRPNTTVTQYFGTVAVEAQVEQVQHFAVQTPYLAAVVKGTKFTVVSGKTGSEVSVQRGHVEVEDHHNNTHVTVSVGQSATIDQVQTDDQIAVAGPGVLPMVLKADGKPLPPIAPSPKGPVPKGPGPGNGPATLPNGPEDGPGGGPKDSNGKSGPSAGPGAGPGGGGDGTAKGPGGSGGPGGGPGGGKAGPKGQ